MRPGKLLQRTDAFDECVKGTGSNTGVMYQAGPQQGSTVHHPGAPLPPCQPPAHMPPRHSHRSAGPAATRRCPGPPPLPLLPTPAHGPGTHRLVVDTHTSGSFMRAKVSRGPPRQAAQLGAAGVTQPAASKISAAVLPSQPGTGSVYTSPHTCAAVG